MTVLLLIRHGVTASTGRRLGGRTQAELSEDGRRQATEAGDRIGTLPVKALYASPLARTWQTAELVGAQIGLEPVADDGLLEVDYGRWTDRPLRAAARSALWPVIQSQPSRAAFPDGETIRSAQQRAVDAVEAMVARHRDAVVAAVSHADVIKAVVAFYLALPLDGFQRLHISPASVTVIAAPAAGRPALLRLNDDGPLRARDFKEPRRRKGPHRG